MAKQPIDVGAKFTADASGFQKAAAQVKGSVTAMKKDIKETAGVFDELGSAIGGMGGEMASTVSSLASAATGIGAIIVIVGALAKAWKTSQENIDLYLKSADKLKAGSGGFTVDAEQARVDTRKRAQGQISLGYKMEQENMAKLLRGRLIYNEEELKHFASLVAEGRQMQKNGKLLRDSVLGMHDKTEWQIKFTKLLEENAKLSDGDIKDAETLAKLDNDRIVLLNKIKDTKNEADKVKILEEYRKKLKEISDYRVADEKEEYAVKKELLDMQDLAQESKILTLEHEKKLVEYTRDYNESLTAGFKLEKGITKEKGNQLNLLKEINSHTSKGYKTGTLKTSFKSPIGQKSLTGGAPGIQAFGGLTPDEIDSIINENKFQDALEGVQGVVESLSGAFSDMFISISAGSRSAFSDMAKAFGRALQQMVAQMAGKAIVFSILSLLSGGGAGIANFASGLLGGRKFGEFMGFASGTNFAPGGLALVGERGPELVNLPRGSQVIPNNKLGGDILITKLRGTDIDIILKRHYNQLQSNT